jgi:CheY-like chemotaxis protein
LALAIHELTTNAAKFGALSASGGCVTVEWNVEESAGKLRLVVEWAERGGPPVEPPARRGFGSQLIERSVEYELGGEVELEYRTEGVRCRIELPLDARGGGAPARAVAPAAREAPRGGLSGARVLVVEDMHVVALEMVRILAEAGCKVIGPAARLEKALQLARAETLDAAILDVNLGGEAVYPVADALKARGVPFFFATGYAQSTIPPKEHAEIQRIDKPVDGRQLVAALRRALSEAQGRATRQTSP